MITLPQLRTICPNAPKNVDVFIPYLNQVMDKYSINTKRRQAAFIAQIAHESGEFKYIREIASGKAYEGRKDLGNVIQGDGVRFKGRGLIQLTGRANYKAISKDLGIDFEANPELLETPQYAVLSAGWYWNKRNLNAKADTIGIEDETRAINGGLNGLSDRQKYFYRAMKVI